MGILCSCMKGSHKQLEDGKTPINPLSQDQTGRIHDPAYTNITEISHFKQAGSDLDGEATGDRSGWRVAMSVDDTCVIVVAAFTNDGNAHHSCIAYVLKPGDRSGWRVAMSADDTCVIIVVAASTNDGNEHHSCIAYVLKPHMQLLLFVK